MLRIVQAMKGEMGVRELMEVMGMKSRPMFLNNNLTPALMAGLLERTQPESPNSPTQRYRLTEAGKERLKMRAARRNAASAFFVDEHVT
jgi:DNA-binding HxlR family transcriptional regulator